MEYASCTDLVLKHVTDVGSLVSVAMQFQLEFHASLLPVDGGGGREAAQSGAAGGGTAPARARGARHITEAR